MSDFRTYDILDFDSNIDIGADLIKSVSVNQVFNIDVPNKSISVRFIGRPFVSKTIYIDLGDKNNFYSKISPFIWQKLLDGDKSLFLKIIDKYDISLCNDYFYIRFKQFFNDSDYSQPYVYFNAFNPLSLNINLVKVFFTDFIEMANGNGFTGVNAKDVVVSQKKVIHNVHSNAEYSKANKKYSKNTQQKEFSFTNFSLSDKPKYLLSESQIKHIKKLGLWDIKNVLKYFNDKTLTHGKGFLNIPVKNFNINVDDLIPNQAEYFNKKYEDKIFENVKPEDFTFNGNPIENIDIN